MTTTQRPETTVDIKLTDDAASQVKGFMQQEEVPTDSAGLRVQVIPGGCSGFQYRLNVEERPFDDDFVLDVKGLRVFIDAFSAQYLNGVTIDYVTTMQGSGFTFDNPNASGGCGCGSSFTV